jgi:hypothetical protein
MSNGLWPILRVAVLQEHRFNLRMLLQDAGQLRAAVSPETYDSNQSSHD